MPAPGNLWVLDGVVYNDRTNDEIYYMGYRVESAWMDGLCIWKKSNAAPAPPEYYRWCYKSAMDRGNYTNTPRSNERALWYMQDEHVNWIEYTGSNYNPNYKYIPYLKYIQNVEFCNDLYQLNNNLYPNAYEIQLDYPSNNIILNNIVYYNIPIYAQYDIPVNPPSISVIDADPVTYADVLSILQTYRYGYDPTYDSSIGAPELYNAVCLFQNLPNLIHVDYNHMNMNIVECIDRMYTNSWRYNEAVPDFPAVTSAANAFQYCNSFNQIVNAENLVNGVGMFDNCYSYNQNFYYPHLNNGYRMFSYCNSFDQDINTETMSSVVNAAYMFYHSDVRSANAITMANVVNAMYMMSYTNLTNLDFVLNSSNFVNGTGIFSYCNALTDVNFIQGDGPNTTGFNNSFITLNNAFLNCINLTNANIRMDAMNSLGNDVYADANSLFRNCVNLAYVNFNLQNFRYFSNAFLNARSFNQSINIPNTAISMYGMFRDSAINSQIYFDSGTHPSTMLMDYMFYNTPYNKPIALPDDTATYTMMFAYSNYNHGIWLPDTVIGFPQIQSMFYQSAMNGQNISVPHELFYNTADGVNNYQLACESILTWLGFNNYGGANWSNCVILPR